MTLLTDGVVIEPMRADCIESFHKALDVVARERKYLTFLEAPSLDSTREFALETIKGGHPWFVAVEDGVVIGWCDIRRHGHEAHAHRGTLGMGILPGYREKGLGVRLIGATLKGAQDIGLRRVELDVHADNERAIRLYERVGFVREGVARDAVLIDGRYIDTIMMSVIYR
ncbi:MAG: GNAT family N-acetyltransferase [Allorhizobium sp.]